MRRSEWESGIQRYVRTTGVRTYQLTFADGSTDVVGLDGARSPSCRREDFRSLRFFEAALGRPGTTISTLGGMREQGVSGFAPPSVSLRKLPGALETRATNQIRARHTRSTGSEDLAQRVALPSRDSKIEAGSRRAPG